KDALVDVQSVLDSLRRPGEEAPRAPAPSLRNVEDLVRRGQAAGPPLYQPGSAPALALPGGVGAARHPNAREALATRWRRRDPEADVGRYADAATVHGQTGQGDGDMSSGVEDDGAGPFGLPGGGGSGIRGMTGRASALGGQLTAGPRPDRGFRVRARLPLGPR